MRRSERSIPLGPAVQNLLYRLKEERVSTRTLLARCKAVDKDRDGIIHINELEDILVDYLGPEKVPRKDILTLSRILEAPRSNIKGGVEFTRLADVLDNAAENVQQTTERAERVEDERTRAQKDRWLERQGRGGTHARGSIGHFLEEIACPAEITNFETLLYYMDQYECQTGLQCTPTADGFVIPLGPDMKASVTFFVDRS